MLRQPAKKSVLLCVSLTFLYCHRDPCIIVCISMTVPPQKNTSDMFLVQADL